jgi:small subunit ribosomal protein S6e
MASFKLSIADPKTGKCYQKEAKDEQASSFIGLNIGESIKGDAFGMAGYEFLITGGSDYCGFPMRRGILGVRKKISLLGGVGFRGAAKGIRKRKTVCGHKINENIVQINLKVVKEGSKKLAEIFGEGKEGAEKKEAGAAKEPKAEEKPQEKEGKKEEGGQTQPEGGKAEKK